MKSIDLNLTLTIRVKLVFLVAPTLSFVQDKYCSVA